MKTIKNNQYNFQIKTGKQAVGGSSALNRNKSQSTTAARQGTNVQGTTMTHLKHRKLKDPKDTPTANINYNQQMNSQNQNGQNY